MAKDAGALKTIGEVARETGVATHILRYWERNVPTLKPLRRAGDRRYYRAGDVDLIRRLQHMVTHQGFTLEGAARAVQAHDGEDAVDRVSLPRGGADTIEQLILLRDRLVRALAD